MRAAGSVGHGHEDTEHRSSTSQLVVCDGAQLCCVLVREEQWRWEGEALHLQPRMNRGVQHVGDLSANCTLCVSA